MVISQMGSLKLPLQFTFPYSDILALILTTILLFIGGKLFFQGALSEFKQKAPSMMALVAMGLAVSYGYSCFAIIHSYLSGQSQNELLFEFASLILIMVLGYWLEMRVVTQAGNAQESLAPLGIIISPA